jgi:basic membrane protein A
VLTLVTTVALVGCSAPPEKSGDAAGNAVDYTACMVSDFGGLDDKGFNQAVRDGMRTAEDQLGVSTIALESNSETDYGPNLDQAVQQDCDLTVTVGFSTADALKAAAEVQSDRNYAIVDDASIDLPNVKPIVYDTAQAAFLAGYLAAGYSSTGVVGVYGGQPFPPVMLFMDGYADGVAHYNEVHGTDVRLLGWDKKSQRGTFAGTFEDIATGKSVTLNLMDQGADVIMPVAGSLYQGSAEAVRDSGKEAVLIGVDNDTYQTAPQYGDVFLSSVMKQMADAVIQIIDEGSRKQFSNEPYIGDLANEGVALAPYHDFEDRLPEGLADEVEALKQQIIEGEIVVESANSPR